MLDFQHDNAFKAFLSANFPIHSGGLLNLAGSCADIDFTIDEQGIADDRDNDLVRVNDVLSVCDE